MLLLQTAKDFAFGPCVVPHACKGLKMWAASVIMLDSISLRLVAVSSMSGRSSALPVQIAVCRSRAHNAWPWLRCFTGVGRVDPTWKLTSRADAWSRFTSSLPGLRAPENQDRARQSVQQTLCDPLCSNISPPRNNCKTSWCG